MDFLLALEQAQQGNYDSYELLINSFEKDPAQVIAFFDYFASLSNPKASRDLVGLFLKNWLSKEQGKTWWKAWDFKVDLVRKVLMIEDNFSVTSLILLSFLNVDEFHDPQVVQLFLMSTSKSAVLALSYYLESSRSVLQVIVNHVSGILLQLLENDTVLALQVFQRSAKHLGSGPLIENIARRVFFMVSSMSDAGVIIEIYKTIVDLISHFYENIQPYVQILVQVITEGVFFNDFQVNSLAYECVNVLVDVEQHRKHEGHHLLNIIETYSEQILLALIKKIEDTEDEEEVLTVSSSIQGICEIIHKKVELLLPTIGSKLKSQEEKSRIAGVYLIGSVLPSLSPDKTQSIKSEIMETIQIALNHQNSKMKNASIWLILKISENIPEIIQTNPEIFEVLFQSLNNPSKIVIDCLLEIADGELKVPFPEKFIEKLMNLGLTTKHSNTFNVVRAIVQSLPNDFPCLVPLINLIIPLISSNHKSLSSLSIILRACIEKLSEGQVVPFYQPLMSLLVSLPLNDEYLVACSCLSRHSIFQNYISSFTAALSNAMSVKESYTSAIICVSELVRNLEFSDWLPPLMPNFVKLMKFDANPNTQLLEAVTDLVSLHTSTCFPFLAEILQYVEYCMRFSLSDYEDTEFLDEVKELIVNFFEGVIQGLENVGKVSLISGKVSDIIKYCLIVTQDIQSTNPNIIAGALGIFADIALAFNSLPEKESILNFVKQFLSNESEMVRMNAECAIKTISDLD
jgi:hypothetical protein